MLNGFSNLRVGVLCSKRAPGLMAMLHHPMRGVMFDVTCVISSDPAPAIDTRDVPLIAHPIHPFCEGLGVPLRDDSARRLYDSETAQVLHRLGVDTILLLGYVYRITAPLLDAFPSRIFNIHDSDLPKFPGLHATRDAVRSGEKYTRSSVHIVTAEIDRGPVVLRSERFEVAPFAYAAAEAGEDDIVRAYAYAQREWMMRSAWGPLAVRALEMVAAGALTEAVA
jgi:folate-dependent phosphoribosylglycinamide formyltransferase PurN